MRRVQSSLTVVFGIIVHAHSSAWIAARGPGEIGVVDQVVDGDGWAAQRARIVLLAADGVSNTEIASRMGFRAQR